MFRDSRMTKENLKYLKIPAVKKYLSESVFSIQALQDD